MSRESMPDLRRIVPAGAVGVAVGVALGVVALVPLMLSLPAHADDPAALLDSHKIIDALAPPPAKTRGIRVEAGNAEARTDTLPQVKSPPPETTAPRKVDLNIAFANASARITAATNQQLDQLGEALSSADLAASHFLIAGHTSATGSATGNGRLSLARAKAVRDYLLGHYRIGADHLQIAGFGSTRPLAGVAPTADAQRRVEISVLSDAN